MTWNYLVPLTRKEVSKWVTYTGTKGASCNVCGETFSDNANWGYLLSRRFYMICADCALNWASGKNVVPPALLVAFLSRHKFKSNMRGMALELMGADTWHNSEEKAAVALYRRLAAGRCDGCKEEQASKVLDIAIDSRRLVVSLCHACLCSGPSSAIDLESLVVTAEVANIVSRIAA